MELIHEIIAISHVVGFILFLCFVGAWCHFLCAFLVGKVIKYLKEDNHA